MPSARPTSTSSGAALSAKARCRIPPVSATRRAAAERERRRGLLAAPERAALGELVDVLRHTGGLAREKSLDGVGELRLPQPVGGPSHLREEAARELVLALRAALEDADPARDAELERLVVAGLEVQARHVAGGAPVPTVKGLAGEDVKGACDRLAFPLGDHEQQVLRQHVAETREEREVQIGRREVRTVREVVAAREETPVGLRDLTADLPAKDDP